MEHPAGARLQHGAPAAPASPDQPPDIEVRSELARILASDLFSRSDRLSAFLTFIVEQTLQRQGHSLKEHVLAIELYGKAADFSTATDPIVRVDARRLRDKLREYYESAPGDPVVISVPKGSYTPVFHANGAPASAIAAPVPVRRSRLWRVAAVLAIVSPLTWLGIGRYRARSDAPPMTLLTVTSFPGAEGMPSLSPDGNFVAFTWTGPVSTATADVWVKAVEGDALRRLTDTPQMHEAMPAWSPDGSQIAFYRQDAEGNKGVFLVSPLGGEARMVVPSGGGPAWTPDGQSLVMYDRMSPDRVPPDGMAIFHHVLSTGARRRLTAPPPGFQDMFMAVSPDGQTVAFARTSVSLNQAAVFVAPMSVGEARQLTAWSPVVGRLAWTPDGREILYPQYHTSGVRLFRIPAGGGEPAPMAGFPIGINMLSVSHRRPGGTFRVAVGYGQPDVGLQLIDLHAASPGHPIPASTPFHDATRIDLPGRFSRDGTRVAFTSDRGGAPQILIADREGPGLRSLAIPTDGAINVGSWSPHGTHVAFDTVVDGNTDIYTIGIDGGRPARLTSHAANDIDPEWSHNGQWIYYESGASGRSEIWKVAATGGTPVQLTHEGGFEPREASDGKSLYYVDAPRSNGLRFRAQLKRVDVNGGAESVVSKGIRPGAWDITDAGVVFVTGTPGPTPTPSANPPDVLEFYSFAEAAVRQLGPLPFPVSRFGSGKVLIASRDGRWVVGSHIDRWERDILVADNVR